MEAILASASPEQVPLLGELSMGISPQASYVISRNLATTYCNSPEASFGSANTFTVQIASATQWMDPLSHEHILNVVNLEAQPHAVLKRASWKFVPALRTAVGRCDFE